MKTLIGAFGVTFIFILVLVGLMIHSESSAEGARASAQADRAALRAELYQLAQQRTEQLNVIDDKVSKILDKLEK